MNKRTLAGDKGTADRIEADDGGYWVRIVTKQALLREGEAMQNCLRNGNYRRTAGDEDMLSESLWSLRKANGKSYALAEVDGNLIGWYFDQFHGPCNDKPSEWSVRQVRHLQAAFKAAGAILEVSEDYALVGPDGMTYLPDKAPPEVLRAIEERIERERQEERRRQEARDQERREREERARAARGWDGIPSGIRALFAGPRCTWDGEGDAPCTVFEALRILPNPLAAYRLDQDFNTYGTRMLFMLRGAQRFTVSHAELSQAGGMPGALNLINQLALANQDAPVSVAEPAPVATPDQGDLPRSPGHYEIGFGTVMFRPADAPPGTPFREMGRIGVSWDDLAAEQAAERTEFENLGIPTPLIAAVQAAEREQCERLGMASPPGQSITIGVDTQPTATDTPAQPEATPASYAAYVEHTLRQVAASVDLPYEEFTRDWRDVSEASERARLVQRIQDFGLIISTPPMDRAFDLNLPRTTRRRFASPTPPGDRT